MTIGSFGWANMKESQQSESFRPSIDHLVENNPFLGYVNLFERSLGNCEGIRAKNHNKIYSIQAK